MAVFPGRSKGLLAQMNVVFVMTEFPHSVNVLSTFSGIHGVVVSEQP